MNAPAMRPRANESMVVYLSVAGCFLIIVGGILLYALLDALLGGGDAKVPIRAFVVTFLALGLGVTAVVLANRMHRRALENLEPWEAQWRAHGIAAFRVRAFSYPCADGGACLLKTSIWRAFAGAASVTFTNDAMVIAGSLGPDELPFFSVVAVLQTAGFILLFYGQPAILLGGLGLGVLEHFYKKFFTEPYELNIAPSDIRSFERNGPFITIRLNHPFVTRLSSVRLFLGVRLRPAFQADFSRLFPGHWK